MSKVPAIVERRENVLALPGEVTPTALILSDDLSEDDWQDIGWVLTQAESSALWWIGDWWRHGDNKKYAKRKAFADELHRRGGFSFSTCASAASVCKSIETCRRRQVLPFNFHAEVVGLPTPELQDQALDWAQERWESKVTIRDMRRYVRSLKAGERFDPGNFPEGKFRILYADPPWSYGNERPLSAGDQDDHYQTLSLDEIQHFKDSDGREVQDLPLDDAVLFLWTTSAMLEDAFAVIQGWGFEYKTSFIWDKVKHNMGHYNSVRHELLLVAGRGASVPDERRLFDSVVVEERSSEHSEKPEIFYDIIETLYPNGRRVELFSRKKREGWDVFGNQL